MMVRLIKKKKRRRRKRRQEGHGRGTSVKILNYPVRRYVKGNLKTFGAHNSTSLRQAGKDEDAVDNDNRVGISGLAFFATGMSAFLLSRHITHQLKVSIAIQEELWEEIKPILIIPVIHFYRKVTSRYFLIY